MGREGFRLAFFTENAAFAGDDLRPEVARILRQVADKVENGMGLEGPINDSNGNAVGYWLLDECEVVE